MKLCANSKKLDFGTKLNFRISTYTFTAYRSLYYINKFEVFKLDFGIFFDFCAYKFPFNKIPSQCMVLHNIFFLSNILFYSLGFFFFFWQGSERRLDMLATKVVYVQICFQTKLAHMLLKQSSAPDTTSPPFLYSLAHNESRYLNNYRV